MRRAALLFAVALVAACGATVETAAPPSPTPGSTPSPSASPAPTTAEPSPSPAFASPSPTPTVEPSPSATPNPTLSPTPSATTAPTASPGPFASPSASAAVPPTLFATLLEGIPRDARSFGYTNWAQIKAAAGVPGLSSRSTMDERVAFMSTVGRNHAAGSSFGLTEFRRLADTWGFDTTDYVWELTIDLEGLAPVYYLQFAEDFDLGPTIARFGERGFSEDVRLGATVYSHAIDSTTSWLLTLLATTNVAVRPDAQSLILSASPEALDRVLAAVDGPALSLADDALNVRLGALGAPEAAVVFPAPDACALLADEGPRGPSPAPWPGGRYEALAITYVARPDGAHGQIVFLYATPGAAAADLAQREQAARDGRSARAGRPYADYVFTVDGASVVGSSIVLDVRPGEGAPIRLFQMAWSRDMTFAACPDS